MRKVQFAISPASSMTSPAHRFFLRPSKRYAGSTCLPLCGSAPQALQLPVDRVALIANLSQRHEAELRAIAVCREAKL